MNPDHLEILQQGIEAWNAWREKEFFIDPELSNADLNNMDLNRANLSDADLTRANLMGVDLRKANLSSANLSWADLSGAYLNGANLRKATLSGVNLCRADLSDADLRKVYLVEGSLLQADLRYADLRDADLRMASLVEADICGADLTGCHIYGISAWGLKLNERTKQQNLVISGYGTGITVDNIEVAQFVYLLLHNEKIREVVDTMGKKVVLILGRFTGERKKVLDALREELRKHDYLPILFDFDKPAGRDITETVSLLAHLARFVVADITDPRSIPQELGAIVPHLPTVPVQPLLLEGSDEYGMFEHFTHYKSVLKTYRYRSQEQLIANLDEEVIRPAEAKVLELRQSPPE